MKPSELSKSLLHIASKINNSSNPSRFLVARELKFLINRISTRSSVLSEIDQTFNKHKIYPPVMVEISKNEYEGEIDTGWVLNVKETPNGSLVVLLNNSPTSNLETAVLNYKNKHKTSKPNREPDWSEKNVPSTWPEGNFDRWYDVNVWLMPDKTYYVEAKLVRQTGGDVINEPTEGQFKELNERHSNLQYLGALLVYDLL